MKKILMTSALAALALMPASAQKVNKSSGGYPITPVPFTSVKVWNNSFWGQRIETSRKVTIPLAFSKCESEGRYKNFERAAQPSDSYDVGKLMPYSFDDTDPYKTIEGASYVLQTYPDQKLKAYIDSVLDIIAPAQEADGYLYTARTQNPKHPHFWAGDKRWSMEEDLSHELYNLGHMVEGAVAHWQATGSRKFLDIAIRYADCVVREVGPNQDKLAWYRDIRLPKWHSASSISLQATRNISKRQSSSSTIVARHLSNRNILRATNRYWSRTRL